jgi:hypothetical protein
LLVVAAALVLAAATSAAGKLFSEAIDQTDGFVEEDFCGVAGLTVEFATHTVGRVQAVPHGRDGLVYFGFNLKVNEVVTNPANGNFVTSVATIRDKDQKVTDNGDGTLSVIVLATGNAVLYDAGGKAIARNPGQIRYELLVDHGGTPSDPSDDGEAEFVGIVKESTGRSDDFCVAVPYLLGP